VFVERLLSQSLIVLDGSGFASIEGVNRTLKQTTSSRPPRLDANPSGSKLL